MASSIANATSSSRRPKRKFSPDPPSINQNKFVLSPQIDFSSYEFSADSCHVNQASSNAVGLDLGLSNSSGSTISKTSSSKEKVEANEFHNADWNDLTESQLEVLVLSELHTIYKTIIKKIMSCGYTEEVATKAVLKSGFCYGCKDTVSNILDNALEYLKNGREIGPYRNLWFKDLHELEKYVLDDFIEVLQALKPQYRSGDAMWCLLISDMDISQACLMDGNRLNNSVGEAASNTKCTELNLPSPIKPVLSNPIKPVRSRIVNLTKENNSLVINGLVTEKEGSNLAFNITDKSFLCASEEKFRTRKVHFSSSKRDSILRRKLIHFEKGHRTNGTKGSSKTGKLTGFGGLILDKELKFVAGKTGANLMSASLKVYKENTNSDGLNCPSTFNLETVNSSTIFTSLKSNNPPTLPNDNNPLALSVADTELSLSLPTKSIQAPMLINGNVGPSNSKKVGIFSEKAIGKWDKKDDLILKLVPKLRELENQLKEWTDWANQRIMQAARRLNKDKAELKTLKQEKEEVEKLKREKQGLEDNTMKKLTEMENVLRKARGRVERANATVRRLEVENSELKHVMASAKLRAAESAASCQEVSEREKNTLMKFQSWEKQKILLQEELITEKRKLAQVKQALALAKDSRDRTEAKWKQEEKAKEELLTQTNSVKKEEQQNEGSTKSKENTIKLNMENNLQRYKADIKNLEKEISQLRLKTDSSKIAALRQGTTDQSKSTKNHPDHKQVLISYISNKLAGKYEKNTTVRQDRECVMCLEQEMCVVFLPCAHQVICTVCNEMHEKQGMKDCPSCRSIIQRRINVRYDRS